MSVNKITFAVAAILFLSPVFISKAHAISAGYRAQLERSGCTQVTESNGTCDIHKTKAQNNVAAHSPAIQERKKIAAFLEESVLEKSTDDAYDALERYGFTNPEPLKWIKGQYVVYLDIHPLNGKVLAATLR